MQKKFLIILIVVILFVGSLAAAFWLGGRFGKNLITAQLQNQLIKISIGGVVEKISPDSLTIVDIGNNKIAVVASLSPKVKVYKYQLVTESKTSMIATEADIKTLKVGDLVGVWLEFNQSGRLEITQLSIGLSE